MPADTQLIAAIRAGLQERADPERAAGMTAYLKSSMPCLGVRLPDVRAFVRAEGRRLSPPSTNSLRDTVHTLWHAATYREERYAGTELLNAPSARPLHRPDLITLCEELIVTGAWWDHVDEVAHRVGDLLLQFPDDIRPAVQVWQQADDRWLRRVSIICQVGARERTDVALLRDAVTANAGDRDIFIRKAIGWALRDYARADPEWVRRFVGAHRLSPLSVREATKHL